MSTAGRFIIYGSSVPAGHINRLSELFPGHIPLAFPASSGVYRSISSHPDIFFFMLDERTMVHSPSVPDDIVRTLAGAGIRLIRSSSAPHGSYPLTASLNAVRIGNRIIHNLKFTDEAIVEAAEQAGLTLVHVNQGYSRCSIIPVGAGALISSDNGIAEQAGKAGFDVLKISEGNIALPGEEYGFAGGACGVTGDGMVVFLGDIGSHPDGKNIAAFCEERGVRHISLDGLPLFDGGGLFFI